VYNGNTDTFAAVMEPKDVSDQGGAIEYQENDDILGLPPWLRNLKNGDTLYAQRQNGKDHAFSIECISTNPPIFIMRNFLSPEECKEILQYSTNSFQAETLNGQGSTARPNCHVSWMECDEIATDVATLCLNQDVWVENLQLLKYTHNGKYVLHHDGHERVLTSLYYLNGIGGTWFPLANHDECEPNSRDTAIEMSQECIPGRDGLLLVGDEADRDLGDNINVVRVQAGDAAVFYNYRLSSDGEAFSDWRTLHAGMPSPQVKRIANHWFHVADDEE
jgi:hypothetical protein